MKGPFLRVFFLTLTATLALCATASAASTRPRVLAVKFENDVNPVTQDYVTSEIDRANRDHYSAVVILLDTPGGLGSSMEKIVKSELASKVPVLVYVWPEGARAASAGVWISQAGDVLAMAPQTNIGSSTPINVGGGNIASDLRRKVVNDAAASLRELAREHGRNVQWADAAVRKASNLGATEALQQNVIDLMAPSLPALLDKVDGRRTKPKGLVLHTAGAQITTVDMSLWKKILDTLIDPNLIVLFMSIGTLGLIVELWNPGLIFPGTVGAISLILGLFGLQVLPISAAGALLMLLAFAFFAAEAFVPTHGAITLAGAVCFVLGSMLLFEPAGNTYQVSLPIVLAIAGTLAALMALVAFKIVQVRRVPPVTGESELVGQIGVVRQPLAPTGLVFVRGELWQARSNGEPLEPGTPVRVERVGEGLMLEVDRAEEPAPVA
ncbi:MAG: nodulation protein NfeD [Actinobacteria bacterium]|nr:MAG: nodulation protein NfeD [Actinomycetota bacterium]